MAKLCLTVGKAHTVLLIRSVQWEVSSFHVHSLLSGKTDVLRLLLTLGGLCLPPSRIFTLTHPVEDKQTMECTNDTEHELLILLVPQTPGSLEAMSPASMSPCREELDGSRMHSRSASPNGAMASIDQLLSEIEQEYNGPGYKYVPRGQSASPQGERETSIVRVRSPIDDRTPAKAFLKSTRDGQLSRDNYDILEPPGPNDNYSYLAPPSKLAQLHRKCHVYETLLPKEEGEDGDTYVYMAPLKDLLNESLPEESIDR